MYVKPGCPYCQAAREHFQAAGEPVEERDATTSEAWKAELFDYTSNRGIVPTIVRDGALDQLGFPQAAAERCTEPAGRAGRLTPFRPGFASTIVERRARADFLPLVGRSSQARSLRAFAAIRVVVLLWGSSAN